MNNFQAQIKQSSPVTVLHSLTCPTLRLHAMRATADVFRVIRARNIEEAMLDLIAVYMSDNVRRSVRVCSCPKVESREAFRTDPELD